MGKSFMLDVNLPRRFSLPEVQTLFRVLLTHIESMPNVYRTEGLCRIPGNHGHIVQITEDIFQDNAFVRAEYKVHDYIGALKYGLMNCVFSKDDKLLQDLKTAIEHGDESADIQAIINFVKALVYSEEKTKYAAGEVIYDYLNFLTTVAHFANQNHMDDTNLGIMAGPLFANLIDDNKNPKALLNTIQASNALCSRFIREKHFKAPFQDVFRDQFEKWRRIEIAELEAERAALQQAVDDFSLKLPAIYEDLIHNQQDLALRKKKPFHSLSKKTKRLEESVIEKQLSLQHLIDEEKGAKARLKKLDAKLETLKDELLPKPGKILRFSMPKDHSADRVENEANLELQTKKKKRTLGTKH